jgi:AcrR family transcriptional regulator
MAKVQRGPGMATERYGADMQEDNPLHQDAGRVEDGTVQGSVQAMRSERTRAALLTAAEAIFARDGFEASRIEDIAAQAGRSRGAFYANFANKTEVFLGLRSRAILRRAGEVRELLRFVETEDARYEAVLQYILEQICDTRALLLEIEFKLFALRHPEMLAELAEKHLEAVTTINQRELADLFGHRKETVEAMRFNSLAIEAVLEGFAVNALFCPGVLTQERLEALVPELLGKIFQRLPAA